jgi:hypothetical protein
MVEREREIDTERKREREIRMNEDGNAMLYEE